VRSYLLGEVALARAARRVRASMTDRAGVPILLGNGGNAANADINWVHSVHHAWPCADEGAPAWFRAKNRLFKAWSRGREAAAARGARLIVANSCRTKQDLISTLGIDKARIHVVYPGSLPSWEPASSGARANARAPWRRDERPLVVMIGAISLDVNKGLDTVLAAWRLLHAGGRWDADLVVAGPGHVGHWRRIAADLPSVRFTGHIDNAGELLDAADLLVSPVRYEAYGLAVHEALSRGVPVLVSRDAGVVERFPAGFEAMVLDAPRESDRLAARLEAWRSDIAGWRQRVEPLGREFRARTMEMMASRIAQLGDGAGSRPSSRGGA
jgi:glycosyltransferase involved in cell wall biosynthesis